MHSPIDVFNAVWRAAKKRRVAQAPQRRVRFHPRFQRIPELRLRGSERSRRRRFCFCTHLDSAKAVDIDLDPKAGMTIWWEHVATQVRIKGKCVAITPREADAHWSNRSRDAQIATATFNQSHPLASIASLAERYSAVVAEYEGKEVQRPSNWGGFRLRAAYIEFLRFNENRLHERTAYTLVDLHGHQSFPQP
jgi:pyridoxamine 5'-phosphate oxidase